MSDRCQKKIAIRSGGWHVATRQCSRKPWSDGFCRQHHPNTVKERQEIRTARWHARFEARDKEIQAVGEVEGLRTRIRALESLVLAADRMRGEASAVLSTDRADPSDGNRYSIHGDLLLDLNGAMNAYDTQRAAVGEIGEE